MGFAGKLSTIQSKYHNMHYRSPDSGILVFFLCRDCSEKAVGEIGLDSGICSILYFSMYGAATSQTCKAKAVSVSQPVHTSFLKAKTFFLPEDTEQPILS